jgi:hypothetical protein
VALASENAVEPMSLLDCGRKPWSIPRATGDGKQGCSSPGVGARLATARPRGHAEPAEPADVMSGSDA